MCALFGWLDYKGIVPYKILKKLTQALANAAEERGTDASGISYVRDGKITIYKRPKPAHRLRFNVPDGTKVVMGHTRLATQGNQKFNFNNHPFPGHADVNFAFAHNGVLYNDDDLRKDKKLPKTKIETDSYIAVQLIEQQGKLDFDSLKSMAEDVKGSFAFTVLDEKNSLYIVKGSSPMYLVHFEALGLYVFASTDSIMKKALTRIGMQNIPHTKIETVDGDIIKIDSKGFLSRYKFETFHNPAFANWYDYGDYYNLHEQMILDMSGCFGVDENDVMLLLDYGYTTDEIEDMLMDYDLLHDTVKALKNEEDYSDFLVEV